MTKKIFAVTKIPYIVKESNFKINVDLEEALDVAGFGKYQIFHCTLMLASLSAAMLEMTGSAFIIPAAACDLDMPDNLRGIVAALPNIGIILTAALWGRAADNRGRKPILLISSAAAGLIGFIASFMPDLTSFALCKLFGSLFLTCPAALGFVFASELIPRHRRDMALLMCNGLLTTSSCLSSVFSWCVLANDWHISLGPYDLRPWRLLTALHAAPLLLTAIWLTQASESPKFLMTKGREQEALQVLSHIYEFNTGLDGGSYPVKSLKQMSEECGNCDAHIKDSKTPMTDKPRYQCLAVLRPPHIKWLIITGFLMFGIFSVLTGLFIFAPDTLNKAMSASNDGKTICTLIDLTGGSSNSTTVCNDRLTDDTFLMMFGTAVGYGVLVILISLLPLSKKTLLFWMYLGVGVSCLLSGLLTNALAAGILMSALQLTSLGVGPISAFTAQLFPTSLRGTAMCLTSVFARVGSVVGASSAGYLLATACDSTFYIFAALLVACALCSLLLPADRNTDVKLSEEKL